MKAYYIILLTLFACFGIKAIAKQPVLTEEQKEEIRQQRLIKLIEEEAQLIKNVKQQNLRLRYRLFELYSEKLKIFKQIENKNFIEQSLKNPALKREDFFNRTLGLYNEAQRLGDLIIKHYPQNNLMAEVYYTMALNSRDYAHDKKSLNFLRKALERSKSKPQLQHYIHTALAEYYYNDKNYKSCIYYYNMAIRNTNDEWLTKNLYNYGWCHFKENNYNTSIDLLVEAYGLSKDKKYIDMSEQVINSLITFHVFNQTPLDALKFIKENEKKPYDYYLTLSKRASDKGYFDETQIVIAEMKKHINDFPEAERDDVYSRLNMFELNFFQQYKKEDLFFNKVTELAHRKMPDDIREELIYFVKPVLGLKQQVIQQEYVPGSHNYNKKTLEEIVGYFSILKKIDEKDKGRYEYLLGETYYGIEIFEQAQAQYEKSWAIELGKKDIPSMKKSLDSWLAALEFRKEAKLDKDEETIRVFKNYTAYFPKDEKTQKIFPRLFNLEFAKKRQDDAFKTLQRFSEFYPNENNLQKDLQRILINDAIEKKKPEILNTWLASLQKGFLNFDREEVQKVEETLAKLLFEQFEILRRKGDFEGAIAGYQQVYFDKQYPSNIRAEAAFNMIFIFVDTNKTNEALSWLAKSFQSLPAKEKQQKKGLLLKQIIRLSLKQDLYGSEKLSLFTIGQFCRDKDKINGQMVENLLSVYLAQNYMSKLFHNYPRMKACANADLNWTELDKTILVHLARNKDYSLMLRFITPRKNDADFMKTALSISYQQMFANFHDDSKRRFYLRIMALSNLEQDKKLLRDIQDVAKLSQEISAFTNRAITLDNKKQFDMDDFNNKLTTRIEDLTQISNASSDILKGLDPHLILLVQNAQVILLDKLSTEVRGFHPNEEDQNFINEFKKQMESLAKNFENEKGKIINKSHKLIAEHKLFFKDAPYIYETGNILSETDYRTPASYLTLNTSPIKEVK